MADCAFIESMTDRQKAYRVFLKTDFWKTLTAQKKAAAGKCNRCPETTGLQSHHTFYRSDWFATELDDLEVLCGGCHDEEHFGPMPDWESPEEEKKYFYNLIHQAGMVLVQSKTISDEMADEINALAEKYKDEPPVVFQIRNSLRLAHAIGVPFKSAFTPLEVPNVR